MNIPFFTPPDHPEATTEKDQEHDQPGKYRRRSPDYIRGKLNKIKRRRAANKRARKARKINRQKRK